MTIPWPGFGLGQGMVHVLLGGAVSTGTLTDLVIRNIAPVAEASIREDQRSARQDWGTGRYIVETVGLPGAAPTLENDLDAVLVGGLLVRAVLQAEQDGCAAVTIDCFLDPCLDACRSVVRIPVVGMGHAALLVAFSLGHSIGVISVLDSTVASIRHQAHKYGFGQRISGYASIGIPCSQLRTDEQMTRAQLSKGCKDLEEAGCDVLVLGCTALEPFHEPKGLGIPVVRPSPCAVELAYLQARLGLSQSLKAYPKLPVGGKLPA